MLAGTLSSLALALAVLAPFHLLAEVKGATQTSGFVRAAYGALVGLLALTGFVSFGYDAAAVIGGMV